jgi:asparagine synthase (glutamine-hydrolysing)
MASLLERKDRMSMAHGLEVRVPFSDHRILDYVYNVPWEIKFEGQVEKALLRNAMAPWLPDEILHRKKSPYPKTHNPAYEALVRQMLLTRLKRKESPLAALLKPGAIESLMQGGDVTWLGQLMSRPQMYAWLLQFDYWLCTYDVDLVE